MHKAQLTPKPMQERKTSDSDIAKQSLSHLPVLMTPDQVADLLMVSPRTLAGWRLRGQGPKFVRLGNKGREMIRYRSSVILAWIEAHERQTTEGGSND
jgi:hypothetical protein